MAAKCWNIPILKYFNNTVGFVEISKFYFLTWTSPYEAIWRESIECIKIAISRWHNCRGKMASKIKSLEGNKIWSSNRYANISLEPLYILTLIVFELKGPSASKAQCIGQIIRPSNDLIDPLYSSLSPSLAIYPYLSPSFFNRFSPPLFFSSLLGQNSYVIASTFSLKAANKSGSNDPSVYSINRGEI